MRRRARDDGPDSGRFLELATTRALGATAGPIVALLFGLHDAVAAEGPELAAHGALVIAAVVGAMRRVLSAWQTYRDGVAAACGVSL